MPTPIPIPILAPVDRPLEEGLLLAALDAVGLAVAVEFAAVVVSLRRLDWMSVFAVNIGRVSGSYASMT